MDKRSIAWGAGILLVAVLLGAFGAHGLKARLSAEALAQWHTGVEYQFIHGLGILLVVGLAPHVPARAARMIRNLFMGGIVCFSGSLFLLSTRELTGVLAITPVLGPLTPLGGALFIAGWAILLITALRPADER